MNGSEQRAGAQLRAQGYSVMRRWQAMPTLGAYEDLLDYVWTGVDSDAAGRDRLLTSSGAILEELASDGRWTKIERLHGAGRFKEASAALQLLISELMGEPYVLFKDKINNKRPGLGHFGWHQDFESYRHYAPIYHVTAMISLTPSTLQNGCLSFAKRYRERIEVGDVVAHIGDNALLRYNVDGPDRGNLEPDLAASFEMETVETQPNDVILFDSFVPHCSSPNRSTKDRAALFLTFNRLREGNWYTDYYERKMRSR